MNIDIINSRIKNTNKAIIAIGDSYTSGAGCINDDIYENYKWFQPGQGYPLKLDITYDEKKDLLKKYPILDNGQGDIHWGIMEHDNSYVSVLCNHYFSNEYTPINFGFSGGANRGRVKELYLNPKINWDEINEIIVIYCPTGPERFDFIDDTSDNWEFGSHYKTIWPTPPSQKATDDRTKLWYYYGNTIYSEKSAIIEQIAIVQELLTWCKLKKARLIITPAFDLRFNKKFFQDSLSITVKRNNDWTMDRIINSDSKTMQLVDLWPWDLMFKPNGYENFAQLVMAQEPTIIDKKDFYFQFQSKRSLNGWMTPCSHPGVKGHKLFAELLFEHISK